MSLPIGEELLKDMSVMVLNYTRICKHLGLTEEQMRSPNAGDWVIDTIKQYVTAYLLTKSARLNSDKTTSVESYHSETQLPISPISSEESK